MSARIYDEILNEIYFDVKNPASFSSKRKLLQASKIKDKNISKNDVDQFLQGQPSYNLHGMPQKTFRKRQVVVKSPGHLLFADLADFQNLAQYNKPYRYIAFCY